MTIRVLVADDQALVRGGIRMILAFQKDISTRTSTSWMLRPSWRISA